MLEQAMEAALSIEKKFYTALLEFSEFTKELSDALDRQDQVSFQLNLNMRQDSVNRLLEYQEALKKECNSLPEDESACLRAILSGEEPDGGEKAQILAAQVKKNRSLLERALQADRAVNQRLGGRDSFYADTEP